MTTVDASTAAVHHPGSPPTKASLMGWWERFTKKNIVTKEGGNKGGIFGVPLYQSIQYANVAISLTDEKGEQFVYGYVPVVVAKCGVYLKEKATDVEGIFRLSGSAKRIKDLQTIFDSPEKYGKGLDWAGYTVHDAANILRRYLNQLPEPIIPLEFYERFRQPLSSSNTAQAIRSYQKLIAELPNLNRQLLLYILDLLAVFAAKSKLNLMNAQNLAAIFQPGLISHPNHDMFPDEYRTSQDVLVFLIQHQDHFLLGMRGTTDYAPSNPSNPSNPTTPSRSKTVVNRSPSNGSAVADDVRKYGGLRRNVSVTSRHSGGSPVMNSGGGLSRSNTVPSKRSPAVSPVYKGEGHQAPSTPRGLGLGLGNMMTRSPSIGQMAENVIPPTNPSSSAGSTPRLERPAIQVRNLSATSTTPTIDETNVEGAPAPVPAPSAATLHPSVTTPTREHNTNFSKLFSLSPAGTGGGHDSDRQPRPTNKLKKKRIPGSTNHSAESSTTSLTQTTSPPPHHAHALTSHPLLEPVPQSPPSAHIQHPSSSTSSHINQATAPVPVPQSRNGSLSTSAHSSATLMPAMSPTPSATSSVTSQSSTHSQTEMNGTNPLPTSPDKKRKTRGRWRISGSGKFGDSPPPPGGPTSPTFSPPQSTGIVDRIRNASRSPPSRRVSSSGSAEGEVLSGDEGHSSSVKSGLNWLKRVSERKSDESKEPGVIRPMSPPPSSIPLPASPKVLPPTPDGIRVSGGLAPSLVVEKRRGSKDPVNVPVVMLDDRNGGNGNGSGIVGRGGEARSRQVSGVGVPGEKLEPEATPNPSNGKQEVLERR
ncbi:GTPase activating protein (GAP) for Rho1p [Rhizina undulata]